MFLRNDSPLLLSSHGPNHTRWRTQLTRLAPSKTLRLRSKCGRIKIIHPITKSEFFCWNSEEHSDFQSFRRKIPDFVLAAFFLSFWSQQKERNEQNSFLHNGIFRLRSTTNSPRQPRSSRKLTPRASQCSQTLCTFLRTYSFAIELRKSAINLRATASSFHGFSSSRLKSSFTG